jgi:ABC-type multidrug transport system fused ATPase/permease subunit
MSRSILVTEIFLRTTRARLGSYDDNAAVTLMSTDMERIDTGFRSLHETWACLVQAALASWLLYNQLGILFVAPIGVVLLSFTILLFFTKFAGSSQRAWMAGVQQRVGLTATVIGSMKSIKLSGLSEAVADYVQKLRVEELTAGSRFRKMTLVAAFLGFVPFFLGPPLTFAFTQRTLDVSRTFTSLSYMTLLTSPLTQIFQAIPQVMSGLACLSRVQAYLECEAHEDFRKMSSKRLSSQEKAMASSGNRLSNSDLRWAMNIKDAKFGWEQGKYVLQDMTTQIMRSALTIVVGTVGSGKSTFCKALLGEIPFSEGEVKLDKSFPRVGVCEQTAFLSNGSIRDNIVGFSPYDSKRYAEVIEATALSLDLDLLPQGDLSNVGSDGISLSGGQKQRVSLARALYLHTDLLVLDDIFSGLDAGTEDKVFRRVFGPSGLLRQRQVTVVLCTHSINHLPAADYIIALGNSSIVEQGTFNDLMTQGGYVHRLRSWELSGESSSEEPSPDHTAQIRDSSTPQKIGPQSSTLDHTTDAGRQDGDKTVYKHYLKSMGWVLAGLALFFAALWGFFTNFPTICKSMAPRAPRTHELTDITIGLTYWSSDVYKLRPEHSWAYYAGLYAFFQICGLMSLLLLAIVIFIVSIDRVGARVHKDALQTLIEAPLSFFTSTDTGVVTNLFSQDLNLVDTELPNALLNLLLNVSTPMGQQS